MQHLRHLLLLEPLRLAAPAEPPPPFPHLHALRHLCSALATPNNDIRRRTLDVAMDLVSPRNIEEVMALLKKEIIAAQAAAKAESSGAAGGAGGESDDSRYRAMLISAIHGCAVSPDRPAQGLPRRAHARPFRPHASRCASPRSLTTSCTCLWTF